MDHSLKVKKNYAFSVFNHGEKSNVMAINDLMCVRSRHCRDIEDERNHSASRSKQRHLPVGPMRNDEWLDKVSQYQNLDNNAINKSR